MRRLLFLIRSAGRFCGPSCRWSTTSACTRPGRRCRRRRSSQMLLLTFPMNLIGCGLNDIYDYRIRSAERAAAEGVGGGGRGSGSAAGVAGLPGR